MGCFSEFWVHFQATVTKLAKELKVYRFSVGETILHKHCRVLQYIPKEGWKDTPTWSPVVL